MHQSVPLASFATVSSRWVFAVAIVAVAAWAASVDTARGAVGESPATVAPEDTDGGGLYIPTEDGRYRPAPLLSTEIDTHITGLVARTVVRHRFRNPGDDWIEAVYVFPLPQGSAVDELRMAIGERVIEGRIEERQQAKRTYEKPARPAPRRASSNRSGPTSSPAASPTSDPARMSRSRSASRKRCGSSPAYSACACRWSSAHAAFPARGRSPASAAPAGR